MTPKLFRNYIQGLFTYIRFYNICYKMYKYNLYLAKRTKCFLKNDLLFLISTSYSLTKQITSFSNVLKYPLIQYWLRCSSIHSLLHQCGNLVVVVYYYILLLNACICKMNIVNFVKQFSSFFAQSGQAVSGSKNKTKNHAYR